MGLQAEDFELVARNLAMARDYPDDIVLNYTIKSLARSHHEKVVPDIENELREIRRTAQLYEKELEAEMRLRPGRTFQFNLEPDERQKELVKRAEISQITSFWAFYIASEKIRSGKRMAFNFSSFCATLVLIGMFVCLFSEVDKALILVVNCILLTLALESGLAGVLFHLKLRSANLLFDEVAPAVEMSAYSLARKAKNIWLAVALLLLFASFSSFCISASSGNVSVLSFVISYGSLVLALECALIAVLFQLKQRAAVEKLAKMTDQMCRPSIYHENVAMA
jgi:hypothetical protein